MTSYRSAFLTALAINLGLLGVIALLWWRPTLVRRWIPASAGAMHGSPATPHHKGDSPVAAGTATDSDKASRAPAAGGTAQTPLAPVQLSPQRLQQIGVTFATATVQNLSQHIRTTGNVEVDERRLSSVQLRFSGWIQQVFVDSTFQRVRKGEPLFTIYSPDLVTTEREYLLARQNRQLLAKSPVPGVSRGAASLLQAARDRLQQWDIPAREIDRLDETGIPRQELEIDSPASGYVTEWHALPQTYAQPQTRLYTIADLSSIWVYANVFQTDIAGVHVGSPASVTVDTYPGRTFHGHVDDIWPQVDQATRTVKVRLVFPNPGLKLLPGMFVNVDISSPLGRHVVIPSSAVFNTGTRALVFIDRGAGYLDPREIQPGETAGDKVIVLGGLKPGERIVSSADFLIDSESQLQAAIGSFMPPPPGAGAAAAMNQPAQAGAKVAFTTAPSPPHKGANTFHVTLADAAGKPLTGAQVEVTFFMPAMPAMGMAAMGVQAMLQETAPGQYQGAAQLQSGGNWQVTITARRDGRVVASQHTTVSATGGM